LVKASIDIGTNTILLLIANVSGNNVEIIEDHHKIARLGEGLDKSGFITDAAIERGRKILEYYAERMNVHKVESLGVVATSAMRDAKNSTEVRAIFEEIINSEIKVIVGDEEARLSFLGSIEDDEQNTVIDIGGGSTEIICGSGSNIKDKISLQTGAVRLSERSNLFYPFSSESLNFADDELNNLFENVKDFQFGKIIAVAGTPNTLAQISLGLKDYSREILHNLKMTSEDLDKVIEIIKSNPQQHLIDNFGVHPNRADIILGGALILQKLLEVSNKDEFTVSSNGLRFGLIKS
jgi:exopolyphosphatase/guanosine-5'-triphosphate,3'-diphosphate pyrophosphatase